MPNWDQRKISNATIFLAGIGALGCVVAEILTMMGIGKLVIVDFDTVELSNLNRQWLFRDEDIGKSKALVAKEHLKILNPSVDVIAFNQKNAMFLCKFFRLWINSKVIKERAEF